MRRTFAFAAILVCVGSAMAQIATDSPRKPERPAEAAQMAALEKAIAPYVAKAKASYPTAKLRFLRGLPQGEKFFVTTRLRDLDGTFEQVFILVARIDGNRISGKISSQIMLVKSFHSGQSFSFDDAELLDWVITKPDGTEEGNFVGKFLDTYKQ